MNSKPTTRAKLRERIALDPKYFLETCTSIVSSDGRGIVPFRLNRPQLRYYNEVWLPGVRRDIVGKSRKWGFTTLRSGLALHGVLYHRGRNARLIAQREQTSLEVAKTIKLLYETAWEYFGAIGEDPRYFLPAPTGDFVAGYDFKGLRSSIRVDTASGRGIGRSDRNDDVYVIELADWQSTIAEDSVANLITSQPIGSDDTRFTCDFNANTNWASSHAYTVWECAQKEHDDDDWNEFTHFFAGTDDWPERYTPEFLAERRRALGAKRFSTDYPRVIADLYVQRDTAVYDADLVNAAFQRTGGKYLIDELGGSVPHRLRILHGVDSSGGGPEADYQTCFSFGWHDSMWWELCPPIRVRVDENIFANSVHERATLYPGVCVVERKWGLGVNSVLRDLETPGLYRHRERDKVTGKRIRKVGFPMTGPTKRVCITDMKALLQNENIGLVTPELKKELVEFEWKTKDDGSPHESQAGNPGRKGAHDDCVDAAMIAMQGQGYDSGTTEWVA